MIALNQYGFGPQLSMKIYQMYKQDTISMIQSNPYKLVEDIEGIGFGRADELLRRAECVHDLSRRQDAGMGDQADGRVVG